MLGAASPRNRGEPPNHGCGLALFLANWTHRADAFVRENVVPTNLAHGPNHCHLRTSKTKPSKMSNTAGRPEESATLLPAVIDRAVRRQRRLRTELSCLGPSDADVTAGEHPYRSLHTL